ncbi:MAG: molybdopterin-dependent oxidoreductase [Verrucomicrobiaceae bacterium]|nr:molybdopterin-dependent oxidoreductase [Verrucomicrobiaceae bacterium]
MIALKEMPQTATMNIDGVSVEFTEGETIYEAAQRVQKSIPTLCYDPRLEAFGACRLCVVEVEGIRNPVASCTTEATAGMVVKTKTSAIEKYRKTLLEMVASENRQVDVDPLRGFASQELTSLVVEYDAKSGRFQGKQSGQSNTDDKNPFILRDYDNCISCYRCVRVCAEQEGDYAINVMNRGFETQIITEFGNDLRDSSCTFCGQCVQTCPTGALADKKAMRAVDQPGEISKTRSICPYCGVGCSVDILTKNEKIVGVQPAMDGPSNEGALCIKGQFAFDFVQHEDRLMKPLVRRDDGELHECEWEEALDRAAAGFKAVREEHDRHAIYGIASGRAPHEAAYTMQKFIRAGFGTNQIDNCSRA